MKKSNELKYDITAGYLAEYDETFHCLKFKDNNETFQIPNIIVDYGVKLLKLFPKSEMLTYIDSTYEPKSNRIYMFLKSKGNLYGLKNKKVVKINLNNIKGEPKMTAENIKMEKRVVSDMRRSYEMTLSDISHYIRQAGSINAEVVMRLIRWNYFENKDPVDFYYCLDKGVNIIITMDMFDLHLWLMEKYGIEIDLINDIQEDLDYYTTFNITI